MIAFAAAVCAAALTFSLVAGDPRLPPVNVKADYQLGGAYTPPAGVRVVSRDRTEHPAARRYSICYVNGYQTQPGSLPWWRAHHP